MNRPKEGRWPSGEVQKEGVCWRWEKGSSLGGEDSFPWKKAWMQGDGRRAPHCGIVPASAVLS